MEDRRQHARRRTLLDGRLEVAKLNGWTLDCTVRNLSEGGARLAVPGDVVVPQNVGLSVSAGPARPARLIWFREGHAGFALTEERRAAPRLVAANDAPTDRLAERIAAIAAKPTVEPRFTGL